MRYFVEFCKYYKGENLNPFEEKDERSIFWSLEKMFLDEYYSKFVDVDHPYIFLDEEYSHDNEGLSEMLESYVCLMCVRMFPYRKELSQDY